MKIIGLIQARMGSTRLPGKVMMPLSGKPLIWHIIHRLNAVLDRKNIIIATTKDTKNDELEILAKEEEIGIYRHGVEDDIVGRLYRVIEITNADAILKVNADCPLVDPEHMKNIINVMKRSNDNIEVVCNKIERTYPLGYSLELIKSSVIKWCQNNLDSYDERELVIQWILENPNKFNSASITNDKDYGDMHLTVDTRDDYEIMKEIFSKLFPIDSLFGMNDTIRLLRNEK
jgi:spore coat polysaccharide biosynthesis protein SpsF